MSEILETVQQQLRPEVVDQISQQLGVDPATAQQAITAALPVVLGGMASHADDPAAAAAIHEEADNHSGILDQIGGLIPGGSAGGMLGGLAAMVGSGGLGGLLGNVLGPNHTAVQDGVSEASGLDSRRAKQLMMILVPIVLAAIAHHKRTANIAPSDVGPTLQRQARTAQAEAEREAPHMGGLLGGIMSHVMQKPK